MAESEPARSSIHTFDIDNYLNPFVPRSRLHLLPTPISHWFGYRKTPPKGQSSNLLVWLFSFLGAFIGIAIIQSVFLSLPPLGGQPVPLVIASFGAAAILEYNTIESPLSQPRNLIVGHFISAVIGVGITKLFRLLPEQRFEDLRWLSGALSVGVASAAMGMTKTVHPPAGATTLLCSTMPEITNLGWWLLPLVLLGSSLMLLSAMLVNNLYKRFPIFWWTPADLTKARKGKDEIVRVKDVEKISDSDSFDDGSEAELKDNIMAGSVSAGSDSTGATQTEEILDTKEKKMQRRIHEAAGARIQIEEDRIVVPDWMNLSQWEAQVLKGFQTRLRYGSR